MIKISQAFIFAAGRGERMRPITDLIPKPLVEVKQKPIIQYLIDNVNKIDEIDKIIINGFYLSDKIEQYIKEVNNPKIDFSKEESKIETGGGLIYALKNNKFDENKPILLLNGDVLWIDENKNDIEKLSKKFEEYNCDIILGLTKTKNYFGYRGKGDFNLNYENGELTKDSDELEYSFVGLQIINPKILQQAPAEYFSMSYFYQNYKDLKINIRGIELDSKFYHIGDIKALEDIEEEL